MKNYSEEWKQVFTLLDKIAGSHSEPRKPREWAVSVGVDGKIELSSQINENYTVASGLIRVREVIE